MTDEEYKAETRRLTINRIEAALHMVKNRQAELLGAGFDLALGDKATLITILISNTVPQQGDESDDPHVVQPGKD